MKLKDLILDRLEVPRVDFCKQVGISRETFYSIINEEHQPRILTIKKICKYFDVDYRDYV